MEVEVSLLGARQRNRTPPEVLLANDLDMFRSLIRLQFFNKYYRGLCLLLEMSHCQDC